MPRLLFSLADISFLFGFLLDLFLCLLSRSSITGSRCIVSKSVLLLCTILSMNEVTQLLAEQFNGCKQICNLIYYSNSKKKERKEMWCVRKTQNALVRVQLATVKESSVSECMYLHPIEIFNVWFGLNPKNSCLIFESKKVNYLKAKSFQVMLNMVWKVTIQCAYKKNNKHNTMFNIAEIHF